MTIKLGQKVKDVITGFQGVVTGRCEYITGCNQVLVQPRVKDDGSRNAGEWFDEDRVEFIDESILTLPRKTADGCDMEAPVK